MGIAMVITLALLSSMVPVTVVAADEVNLLPNGGFERDTDGDGVPDGWLSQPHHFSSDTPDEVQTHIANLPSHEQLLKGKEVLAADGWPIAKAAADGTWGAYEQTPKWRATLSNIYLPQGSRFGQLPLPEGLDLGTTTLVIHNRQPHEQTVSEPITVKPNAGYRLSYWFRMSGGSEDALFQIVSSDAPRNNEWPGDGTDGRRQVISNINLGWAWAPYWQRYEIAFRTGPEETSIRLRPWKYFRGYDDRRRAWYDNFRLVEDNSVRVGNIGGPVNPEPQWPHEAVERGFTVVPRPTLPLTYGHYEPVAEEIDQPLVITAAPGQFASGVIFIKALKEFSGPLVVGPKGQQPLNSPFPWVLAFVEYRVCHPLKIGKNGQQWEMRPHYLMPGTRPEGIRPQTRTVEVDVPKGDGRSVWVTVFVPNGTAPGDYKSEIHVVAPDKDYVGVADKPGKNDGYSLPFTIRVRDIELLEADASFAMYCHTVRPHQLPPTSDYRSYIDQRRHGMNSVDQGGHTAWRYTDNEGKPRIDFSAFDYDMDQLVRAGFSKTFNYYPGGDARSVDVQLAILDRCREKGYPEPLFYVHDEPSAQGARLVESMEKEYGEARRKGLRTVTAGLDWRTQGEAYDVWILDLSNVGSKDWPDIKARAAELGAEVWAYDCSPHLNTHPRNIRFYTGLWTWAAGLKGNWIWEYGAGPPSAMQSVYSLSDTIPPKTWCQYGFAFSIPSGQAACTAWEARRDGVNDYRYLYTLDRAIAETDDAGKADLPSVVEARKYLDGLRARTPLDAFSYRKRPSSAFKQFQETAPDIAPEEYDALQENCAKHIIAIRKERGA
jgi:hypothetical protein